VDLKDPEQVQEFVNHSWYKYGDETKGLHPFDGVTEPNFVLGAEHQGQEDQHRGDRRRRQVLVDQGTALAGHPWKSARWPATSSATPRACPEFKEPVDMVLKKLDVPITALFSTLGRTAARGLEAAWAAHKLQTTSSTS
jgi:hydrogenase large subunit